MRPVLKSEGVPQLEGWGILIFLAILEFSSFFLVFATEGKIFPSLSVDLLARIVQILAYFIILAFCIIRFGRVNLIELAPERRDVLVLLLALFAEFWVFGLLVGSEGVRNDYHESIQEFSPSHYWLAVSIFVLGSPFLEEAIFRRYFLEIQRQHYSVGVAILITAGASTLFHFDASLLRLSWVFFQQVFLSFVYVKSRLGVSVLVHAFVNGLILFLSR